MDQQTVGAALLMYAFGGSALICVLVNALAARLVLAAVLGLVAAILYVSSPGAYLFTGHEVLDTALLTAATVLLAAFFSLVIRASVGGRPIRVALRRVLVPSQWSAEAAALGPRQRMKRWFVAIAAATGSWAGTLMAAQAFWEAFRESLQPGRILSLLALTLVVIVLVGPVEEYVLGRNVLARSPAGLPEIRDHEKLLEELWKHFTWRALGRVVLVILVGFQISVIHSSLESASGEPTAVATAFVGIIGPLIVAYYWSSALQINLTSVKRRAGWATFVTYVVLALPAGIQAAASAPRPNLAGGVTGFAGSALRDFGFAGVALAVGLAAILVPATWSAVAAMLGGLVLDRARRKRDLMGVRTTLLVGGSVIGVSLAVFAMMIAILAIAGFFRQVVIDVPVVAFSVGGAFLPTVGWTVGLILSGFPGIVATARAAAPADIAANRAEGPSVAAAARTEPRLVRFASHPAVVTFVSLLAMAAVADLNAQLVLTRVPFLFLTDPNMPLAAKIDRYITLTSPGPMPQPAGDGVTLVAATRRAGDTVAYLYEVTDRARYAALIARPDVAARLAVQVCSIMAPSSLLLHEGARIVDAFRDATGAVIGETEVTKEDCPES